MGQLSGVGRALRRWAWCVGVAAWAAAGCATPPEVGFGSVAYPLGEVEHVVLGLPVCGNSMGIGAVGIIHDGQSVFVSDWCNATTYRFSAGAKAPWPIEASKTNGITSGLAYWNGGYYGIAGGNQSLVEPGVYQFDPSTLELQSLVTPAVCPGMRGLAADPTSGSLLVSGDCGLWRIDALDSALPTVTRLAEADLDGIAVSGDGQIWVADVPGGSVCRYQEDGNLLFSQRIVDAPIGVAVAPQDAPAAVRGRVIVNNTDGVISMLDPNAGNRVDVLATGGRRGEFAVFGPEGSLYVTQPAGLERFGFAGSPGPPRTFEGPRQVPYSLLLASTLLLVTCGVLLVVRRMRLDPARRRQVSDVDPARPDLQE